MQLFSTVSVQYVPSWSKETVALLRKVSPARGTGPPGHRVPAGPASCPEGARCGTPLPGGVWLLHVCLESHSSGLPTRPRGLCPPLAAQPLAPGRTPKPGAEEFALCGSPVPGAGGRSCGAATLGSSPSAPAPLQQVGSHPRGKRKNPETPCGPQGPEPSGMGHSATPACCPRAGRGCGPCAPLTPQLPTRRASLMDRGPSGPGVGGRCTGGAPRLPVLSPGPPGPPGQAWPCLETSGPGVVARQPEPLPCLMGPRTLAFALRGAALTCPGGSQVGPRLSEARVGSADGAPHLGKPWPTHVHAQGLLGLGGP